MPFYQWSSIPVQRRPSIFGGLRSCTGEEKSPGDFRWWKPSPGCTRKPLAPGLRAYSWSALLSFFIRPSSQVLQHGPDSLRIASAKSVLSTSMIAKRGPVFMVMLGGIGTSIMLLIVIFAAIHFRYRRLGEELKPNAFYDVWLWLSIVVIAFVGVYGIVKLLL